MPSLKLKRVSPTKSNLCSGKSYVLAISFSVFIVVLFHGALRLGTATSPLLSSDGDTHHHHHHLRSPADKTYNHGDHFPFLVPAHAPPCTEEQRSKLIRQLGLNESRVNVAGCQTTDWLDLFYEEEADIGTETFVGISIGCNKGDDAIHMARMGMSDGTFDISAWKDALGGLPAAACPEHHDKQKELRHPTRGGEMHCVEPMPKNIELLRNGTTALGLDGDERFVVVNAAISSRSGSAKFPEASAGTENMQLLRCPQTNETRDGCSEVEMYSLSGYVEKFVKSRGPINILSIDTEGLDFEVLFSAGPVLDRVYYLEFEYHEVGELHTGTYVFLLLIVYARPFEHAC